MHVYNRFSGIPPQWFPMEQSFEEGATKLQMDIGIPWSESEPMLVKLSEEGVGEWRGASSLTSAVTRKSSRCHAKLSGLGQGSGCGAGMKKAKARYHWLHEI